MRLHGQARRLIAIPAALGLAAMGARAVMRFIGGGLQASTQSKRNAADALISTDANQIILHANAAAAAMFGTTVHAMQGVPLEKFIPRDLRMLDGQPTTGHFGDTGLSMRMLGRRATDYAVTGLKANGAQFPLEGSISGGHQDGRQTYSIVLRDITERKHVQQRLEQSYSQLRKLSAALQTIREEERTFLARELHDDLGQLLAILRLDLTMLKQQTVAQAETQRVLQGMDAMIVKAITSLRRIASNLRPRALDEGGLYFALHSLRQDFVQRNPIHFELMADEADLALDDAHSTAIYRIVQEALTNITRHAQASNITVALHRLDSKLAISIQDDGLGLAAHDMEKSSSFGLLGMRERVWGLHGDITIGPGSDQGDGMRIDILLPLPQNRRD